MNLLDLVFPRRCVGCGRIGFYFCPKCRKRLILLPQRCLECDRPAIDGVTHPRCLRAYGLDGLVTVFQNRGSIAKAIKLLKYRLVTDVAATLIDLIPERLLSDLPTKDGAWTLYPLPLHKQRQRWRGFNQAEVMGKYLSKCLKIPLAHGLLIRHVKRMPQAEIKTRSERLKNAQGIFSLATKGLPTHIILFDDVWTTGATMKEVAKILKRGGVKKVWGITLAR